MLLLAVLEKKIFQLIQIQYGRCFRDSTFSFTHQEYILRFNTTVSNPATGGQAFQLASNNTDGWPIT